MNAGNPTAWTTLLTAHKGVDLHAATALTVMRDRLEGGEHLVGLYRCQWHAFAAEAVTGGAGTLLETGRYYNPNKHHYGVFTFSGDDPWQAASGAALPGRWPGTAVDSDLEIGEDLYAVLLGGHPGVGFTAVDVASRVRGQQQAVCSGVLWRLVLDVPGERAVAVAGKLSVARRRKEGLLVNPHLERWLLSPARPGEKRKGNA